MALKPLRSYNGENSDIAYVMNEVAEKGIVVIHNNTASGTGKPGDSDNLVEIPAGQTGTAVGVLATDVVSIDLSRHNHIARFHRDEVPVCSPVNIIKGGYVYTNMLASGASPARGALAYFTANGLVTDTPAGQCVGRFRGVPDSDGYVGLDIDIQETVK